MRAYMKRSSLVQAFLISAAVVAIGVFLGDYNNKAVPVSQSALAHYSAEPNHPLKFLANWDGKHYIAIANHGYTSPSDPAFFPLYPLLIALFKLILGSPLTAALAISWLSLVGATYYYMKLVSVWWRPKNNERLQATLMFLLFPTAVFMLAAYTEALFIFLSLAAVYYAATKKYVPSALFLLGASATRVTSVFTIVLVLLLMVEQKAKLASLIRTAVISVLGLLAYAVYLHAKFHSYTQFITAQKYWGRFSSSYVSSLAHSINLLNVVVVCLLVATVVYWQQKKRHAFAVYTALFLVIPFGTGNFLTFNRIALPAFPIIWMLYEVTQKRPTLRMSLLCLMAVFWTYFLLQFAGGYNGG